MMRREGVSLLEDGKKMGMGQGKGGGHYGP